MITRATAIPLAIYPYSSTSHIVHWLTRFHGKLSTLLKGALRPNSRFLGEYELFSTSELLYFEKPNSTLYTAKECSLLEKRPAFRTNWRAMQAASYLATLFNKTTPENAPHPELFVLYENLLDYAAEFGQHPAFLPWAELKFCEAHGHAPNLGSCVLCSTPNNLGFSAPQGGTVCKTCSTERNIPIMPVPPEVLQLMRSWIQTDIPQAIMHNKLSEKERMNINGILGNFMRFQFDLNSEHRLAAIV